MPVSPPCDREALDSHASGIGDEDHRLSTTGGVLQSRARDCDQRQPVQRIDLDIFMAGAAHPDRGCVECICKFEVGADFAPGPVRSQFTLKVAALAISEVRRRSPTSNKDFFICSPWV